MKPIRNVLTTFACKRYSMTNVYITPKEAIDLLDNLTTAEHKLFLTVHNMIKKSPAPEELKNENLAKLSNVAEKTIRNAKAGLKKKGYLVIGFGKNHQGKLSAEVYIGKEIVELYNLGLNVDITDVQLYRELCDKFQLDDPNAFATLEERKEAVRQANEYAQQISK